MTSPPAADPSNPSAPVLRIGRIIAVLLLFVACYFGYALWTGIRPIEQGLARFHWWTFAAAIGLAFGNYTLRFLKWQYYLAVLGVEGVGVVDSFLTFLSGFVLTISPGKVGEVFKSVVLFETHGVPVPRTGPIVVAERVTDMIGIILLIVVGSLGFRGGMGPAAVGAGLVASLLVVVSSRRLSLGIVALVARLPGLRRLAPRLTEAYESLSLLVAPSRLFWPTVLSTAAWSLECFALAVILHGFAADIPVVLSVFFYATSTLAGAIVVLTPGGLGVTEEGLREQMMNIGHVDAPTSTAAMMLVRFATLWFAVLVGFLALGLLKRRYPKLLAR